MSEPQERITLEVGTVVHIKGIPVELAQDTAVLTGSAELLRKEAVDEATE